MINAKILSAVSIIYLVSSILYLAFLFLRGKKIGQAATLIASLGFFGHTAGFLVRWIESYQSGLGHFHVINLYESLTFTAWSIILIYLVVEFKIKIRTLGAYVLPISGSLMMYASFFNVNSTIEPLPVVLQGNFYNLHVIPCFLSYAAFTVSFGASSIFLMKGRKKKGKLPSENSVSSFLSVESLDTISYKAIAIGFLLFTFQMAAGIFRTNIIWGSYWSWDLVQICALITFLIYLIILHGRFVRSWGGHKTAVLSVVGFMTIVAGFIVAMGKMFSTGHYPING